MNADDALLFNSLQGKATIRSRLSQALIITGPTCSGKSTLALGLAQRLNGVVINADAMQVYRELRITTARPSAADEAAAPHRLYGVRSAAEASSVAWWREAALAAMQAAAQAGQVPILCGGTGLYLASLTQGLAEIPDPGAARAEARRKLAELGPAALHARLRERDPATAARLEPADGQRIARAWEVLEATGRGLAAWQAAPSLPPAPYAFRAVHLDPPRAELRAAIAIRFAAMVEAGALDEVRALLALGLDPALPAMRAHGVPELSAYLRGALSLEEAIRRGVLVTGQYTKRQATWFRHRKLVEEGARLTISSRIADMQQFSERVWPELSRFIAGGVDAQNRPA